jgi:hypothetical protein
MYVFKNANVSLCHTLFISSQRIVAAIDQPDASVIHKRWWKVGKVILLSKLTIFDITLMIQFWAFHFWVYKLSSGNWSFKFPVVQLKMDSLFHSWILGGSWVPAHSDFLEANSSILSWQNLNGVELPVRRKDLVSTSFSATSLYTGLPNKYMSNYS